MRSANYSPNQQFRFEIDSSEISLKSHSSVNLVVRIDNVSAETLEIVLSSTGLPADWMMLSHQRVTLHSCQYQYVNLAIAPRPDQKWEVETRTMTFSGEVVGDSAEQVALPIAVNLPVVQQFTAQLAPQQIKRGNSAELVIDNQGNRTELFNVRVASEDAGLNTPPPQTVDIDSGESTLIPISVTHRSPHLIGSLQTYPFQVQVENEGRTETTRGKLVVHPRIPPLLQGLLAAALLILGLWLLIPGSAESETIPIAPSSTPTLIPALSITVPKYSSTVPHLVMGCDRPAIPTRPEPVPTLPNSTPLPPNRAQFEAIRSLQFLDLPFPYDGSKSEFIRLHHEWGYLGGRAMNFFDHQQPLYGGSAGSIVIGSEPATFWGKELRHDGLYRDKVYSGHPAIDYMPELRGVSGQTPLLAAAAGDIVFAGVINSYDSDGIPLRAVWINHEVPDVGLYQTRYLHLTPDSFFDATVARMQAGNTRVGQGEQIGTIGDTGISTEAHLHFEVRFDQDQNQLFGPYEVVDPFGYVPAPNANLVADPWNAESHYLWTHRIGFAVTMPEGGGMLPSAGGGAGDSDSGCAPANAVPSGSTVYYGWAQDPPPQPEQVGVGSGCLLTVIDPDGNLLQTFDQPIKIQRSFDVEQLKFVDLDSLKIVWQTPLKSTFEILETTIDLENGVAIAETNTPGRCALVGTPLVDVIAPTTFIEVVGGGGVSGEWYDSAEITLSTDGKNDAISYTLDSGKTWAWYTAPFFVSIDTEQMGDYLDFITQDENELLREAESAPANTLIQARAVDLAGNLGREAVASLLLGARRDLTITATSTSILTVTATVTPTTTPTATPTATPTTAPTVTAAPILTPTVTPTPTLIPIVTATLTPVPTATPLPLAVVTDEPTPTSTSTVTLAVPGSVTFSADKTQLNAGEVVQLTWESDNLKTLFLNDDPIDLQGSLILSPTVSQTYQLRGVDGLSQTVTSEVIVVTIQLAVNPIIEWFGPDELFDLPSGGIVSVRPSGGNGDYDIVINGEPRAAGDTLTASCNSARQIDVRVVSDEQTVEAMLDCPYLDLEVLSVDTGEGCHVITWDSVLLSDLVLDEKPVAASGELRRDCSAESKQVTLRANYEGQQIERIALVSMPLELVRLDKSWTLDGRIFGSFELELKGGLAPFTILLDGEVQTDLRFFGSCTNGQTLALQVSASDGQAIDETIRCPDQPTLLAPADGATFFCGQTLQFEWTAEPEADAYQFQLFPTNQAETATTGETRVVRETQLTLDLLPCGNYNWQVVPVNASGNPIAQAQNVRTIRVVRSEIVPIAPSGPIGCLNGLTLVWEAVAGALSYDFQVEGIGTSTSFNGSTEKTSATVEAFLTDASTCQQQFYWRVRPSFGGTSAAGTGAWSEWIEFDTVRSGTNNEEQTPTVTPTSASAATLVPTAEATATPTTEPAVRPNPTVTPTIEREATAESFTAP